MTSDAQRKAVKKYEAAHTISYKVKLNKRTDAEVIKKLKEVSNRNGYFKALIRADLSGNISWNTEV